MSKQERINRLEKSIAWYESTLSSGRIHSDTMIELLTKERDTAISMKHWLEAN